MNDLMHDTFSMVKEKKDPGPIEVPSEADVLNAQDVNTDNKKDKE